MSDALQAAKDSEFQLQIPMETLRESYSPRSRTGLESFPHWNQMEILISVLLVTALHASEVKPSEIQTNIARQTMTFLCDGKLGESQVHMDCVFHLLKWAI